MTAMSVAGHLATNLFMQDERFDEKEGSGSVNHADRI
jgi:hypothetical protein